MTDKEKEAIKEFERLIKLRKNKAGEIKFDTCIVSTAQLEIVLTLIQTEQAEIKEYRFVPAKDGVNMTKESIDLKELEKFGFKYSVMTDWHKENYNMLVSLGDKRELDITCDDDFDNDINECIEWIYDLIKADLVEKGAEDE